jgi:hypothetical protein
MEDNRKYYGQQCQDEKINIAFASLHTKLVNEVIQFCRTYNIDIDEFYLKADGISSSIPYGEWRPCTDSALTFYNDNKEEPFMYNM